MNYEWWILNFELQASIRQLDLVEAEWLIQKLKTAKALGRKEGTQRQNQTTNLYLHCTFAPSRLIKT